jgi:hypothetical protein
VPERDAFERKGVWGFGVRADELREDPTDICDPRRGRYAPKLGTDEIVGSFTDLVDGSTCIEDAVDIRGIDIAQHRDDFFAAGGGKRCHAGDSLQR